MLIIIIVVFFVGVAVGCAGFMIFGMWSISKDNYRLTDENQRLTNINEDFRKKGNQIFAENQRLAKWKSIINAEDKAREILAEAARQAGLTAANAKKKADQITHKASSLLTQARQQSESMTANAKQDVKHITNNANDILTHAMQQSKSMLADAKQDAERFTNIANAMRNKIEGYGIEYLVPGISLLDDLADDFGYAQAGKNFKAARENTRRLFKAGLAGECGYPESDRRQTAIAFVADAFNGKVDDILSRVRHDNYGKLAQEIRDSATLVGHNGAAFRNACITPEYVKSRLKELHCAVVLHELKIKEREEQQEELQEQLRLAQEQIRLAEEKKRTISMAEQTKSGHVYVISNIGSFGEGVYKVGMTRRKEPQERVDELGDASVPFPFDVHAMIHSNNAPELEKNLHHVFLLNQVNKTNHRKEFFRADLSELRDAVEKLGGQAHLTMVAEAEQYRETLRMEERLTTDTAYRQEWESRQLRLEQLVSADAAE